MPAYYSLIGGYYADPSDFSLPVAIRMNNPGALNSVEWIRALPGYVNAIETTPGNKTALFEAPEYGVAAWYKLMVKYRAAGATSVKQIIDRYGGSQDYSKYVTWVTNNSGLKADHVVRLNGDDETLCRFARAMFRYEAGRESPLSDEQILYGFIVGRGKGIPAQPPEPEQPRPPGPKSWWERLIEIITGWLRGKPAPKPAPTPSPAPAPTPSREPRWLTLARKDIGFREVGVNRGIEKFIDGADGKMDGKGIGKLGDPWCAIGVNCWLEMAGVPGTRSAMARSFERHKHFVQLGGPALGAIATFWRGSQRAGTGHVNLYVGTLPDGRNLGLGANQSDQVNIIPMDMGRHTGWWWPRGEPLPKVGAVRVANIKVAEGRKET